MRFSLLLLTGMAVVSTALPQRPDGSRGRSRGGKGFGQSAQSGAEIQGTGSENAQGGAQPPVVVPDNAQAGAGQDTADEGNLNDQDNLPPNDQSSADKGSQAAQGGATNQGTPNDQGAGNATQNGTNIGVSGQDQSSQQTSPNNQDPNNQTQTLDPSLIPPFGIQPGLSPDGQGNCLGLNDVKIPCSCPPNRQDFIRKVQSAVAAGNSEGVPVEFPLDGSPESKRARIQTSIVVLQNLNGRGVGCPAAATTFLVQKDGA